FCLRIFIAFSRLSRTSTSTGFPNEFSMGSVVGTRSRKAGQARYRGPEENRVAPQCRPMYGWPGRNGRAETARTDDLLEQRSSFARGRITPWYACRTT